MTEEANVNLKELESTPNGHYGVNATAKVLRRDMKNGIATVCPMCGEITRSVTGFCVDCERKHGVGRGR